MWSQCPKQLELYPLGIKLNFIWWFSCSSLCLPILQTAPHGITSILPFIVGGWRNQEVGISPGSFPSGCGFLPSLSGGKRDDESHSICQVTEESQQWRVTQAAAASD